MKKHSSRCSVSLWATVTTMALGILTGFQPHSLRAQCPLTCLAQTQLSLDPNGEGLFLPVNGLASVQANCLPDYTTQLFDLANQPIGNAVDCSYLEQNLTFRVTYGPTGNSCWGKVLIQDKLPPVLTCSGGIVLCTQSSGPEDAGTLTLSDNCDPDPELLLTFESITPLPCNHPDQYIQRIERRWMAVDASGNASPTCTQEIFVQRATLFNVTFPGDLVGPNALDCATADLDTALTGSPRIFGSAPQPLCKILFSYMDDTTAICPGSYLVTRNWTALDCCTGEVLNATQSIQVVDSTPPVLICPDDRTISTDETVCTATVTLASPQISDACSPTVNLEVTTSWGGSGQGPFPNIKEGGYVIHYTATDSCGNTSTCSSGLVVKDLVPPKAICRNPVLAHLNGQGVDTVYVADVDAGSVDNCTMIMAQIKFMGEPDSLYRDSLLVDCSMIGVDTMIVLKVEDCWANAALCMTSLQVLDTLPPFLICPDDTILSCITFQNYPDLTELATATDNCDLDSVIYVDVLDLNPCHVGTITRTYTAEDAGGNLVSCTQLLTLVDTTAPVIIWPADLTISCETPLDPVNTGEPDVSDDCALLAVGFRDSVVQQPGCDRLLRIWRVKDWCSDYDSLYTQVIQLTDDVPIVPIDCPDDLTVFVDESCTALVTLDTVVAFDECGHFIFVTNDSPFADSPGADASGTYPIGEYTITFMISDACNDAECVFDLSVRDNVPPFLTCSPLIECIGEDSTFILDPFLMIDSVGDVCSAVTVTASPNTFDCDDILKNIPITLTATDAQGNVSTCIDTLFLQNCDICVKSIAGGGLQLDGIVQQWDGQPLANVPIEFDLGIYSDWTLTDTDGHYQSPIYPPGIQVQLRAHPVPGNLDGLTTGDVLAIAGHLTGGTSLDMIDSWLAADVNRSGSISIADLVSLRRSILQQISGMKAGFWRMMPALDELDLPLGDSLQGQFWGGYYQLDHILGSISDLDFKAVKAGDVDRTSSQVGDQAVLRQRISLDLASSHQVARTGDQIRLSFSGWPEEQIIGFQMALRYDTTSVQFEGLQHGQFEDLGPEHVYASEPGLIRFSWDNLLAPQHLSPESSFSLDFTALSPLDHQQWIWLDRVGFPAECYLQGEQRIPLDLRWRMPASTTPASEDVLYNPEPNPFSDQTWIPLDLAAEGPVSLTIFHPNGTMVYQYRGFLPSGYHRLKVTNESFQGAGIYHCRLTTPRGIHYRSLVHTP